MLWVFQSIKCLKISCFGKISKKEVSELETCRMWFGISKGALCLLTKESKAGLLGTLPPMHPREFAGCGDQGALEVQSTEERDEPGRPPPLS